MTTPPAHQLVVLLNGRRIATKQLDKDLIRIGRHATCDVVLDGQGVSRIHAMIEREPGGGGGYTVSNIGAIGATFLNGEKLDRANAPFYIGDQLLIGQYELEFQIATHEIEHRDQKRREAFARAPTPLPEPSWIDEADIVEVAEAEPRAKPQEQRRPSLADNEMVLVATANDILVPAPLAKVVWSASAEEMMSEPKTGEVFIPPNYSARSLESALEEISEPVYLLTQPKLNRRLAASRGASSGRGRG